MITLDICAFCHALSLRPRRHLVRTVSPTIKWFCSSSYPTSGRGAWDLDRSVNRQNSRPNTNRFDVNRRPFRGDDIDRPYQTSKSSSQRWSDRQNSKTRGDSLHTRSFQRRKPGQRGRGLDLDREVYSSDGVEDKFRSQSYSGTDEIERTYRREMESRDNRRDSPERTVLREALDNEDDDLIYGISPVLLALRSDLRETHTRIFVQQRSANSSLKAGPSRKQANADAIESIMTLVTGLEVPIVTLSKGDLNLLSENRPHQGVVLQTSKREFADLKVLPTVDEHFKNKHGRAPCYLVLDEITDPQNAGALLRSAHFLGADGVIVCKRNSCSLSAVVSKASAGAMEMMTIYGVSSMPRFLNASRDAGWRVVGMSCGSDAVPAKQLALNQPTLIVLGSEGRGLRPLVRQTCNFLVEIEGAGSHGYVDSLNVSVAGAVALYQLLGR